MLDSLVAALSLGFILGLEHALEPDHLIAVSVVANEQKNPRATAWVGAVWGLGHTTTLFIIGSIVLITKISIPIRLALSLEFLVGVMLVLMGLNLLRKVIQGKSLHSHFHQHDDERPHIHLHSHQHSHSHDHSHQLRSSFLVGLLHGSAGSAALIILVLSSVDSLWNGLAFILIFGFGSVIGMMLVGAIMTMPMTILLKTQMYRRVFGLVISLLSIVIGISIMTSIFAEFS